MNSLSFTRAERGMFYNEPSNFRNRKYLKLADGGEGGGIVNIILNCHIKIENP